MNDFVDKYKTSDLVFQFVINTAKQFDYTYADLVTWGTAVRENFKQRNYINFNSPCEVGWESIAKQLSHEVHDLHRELELCKKGQIESNRRTADILKT
jgi:hypothetical protein